MEKLETFTQNKVLREDMSKIQGGGFWSTFVTVTDQQTGETVQQRHTWFGLYGTNEVIGDHVILID